MKIDFVKFKLLILLIFADIVFVILHILNAYTGLLSDSLYSLARDRGYAEFFQYTKLLWIVILLFILAISQHQRLYYIFSLLFFYLLVDDSFEVHERVGEFLAEWLNFQPAFGLRAMDFGELLVSALFGAFFLFSIAHFYLYGDPAMRQVTLYLAVMIVSLAGFGVLLDMIGVIAENPGITRVLSIIEEAGEMVVMSIITWYVFSLPSTPRPIDQP